MILESNWLQGTTILITGVCGFLGRHAAIAAAACGAQIIGYDKESVLPAILQKLAIVGRFKFVHGNFFKQMPELASALKNSLSKSSIYMLHFGGLANVSACETRPEIAFDSNVQFTWEVVEFCRRYGISGMVFPSTGYVYETDSSVPLLETSPVKVYNMYTATKLAAESLVIGHARANHYNALVVRLSNVYGPDSSKETVIGKIIAQARTGQRIVVDDETSIRDFIFIDDVIEGIFKLIEHFTHASGYIINLSTGIGTSIRQIVDIVSKILNQNEIASRNTASLGKPGGSSIVLANQLLHTLTGWKPSIFLTEGLNMSISNQGE